MIDEVIKYSYKDGISASLDKLINKMGDVGNAVDKVDAKFKKGFDMPNVNMTGIDKFQMKNAAAISAVGDALPELAGTAARLAPLLTNPYTLGTAAAVGFGVAAVDAYKKYGSFNQEMSKFNVTAQLSKSELSELEDQMIRIGASGKVPVQTLNDIPIALNKIVSAGQDVPTALKTLEPTLLAAKAGFTDIDIVAKAAVSTMNSAGISDATKVYDILFATLNKGNAEFQDVANYLPKIIPGALQVGSSLEEVSGAWAYLTAQGRSAEGATTLLENAFKALATPDRIKSFNKLGVSIFDVKGNLRGLPEIAEQLGGKLDGLTDAERIKKLSSLGLDMEAAAAFASLTGNVDKLKESIDFTTNSGGQLAKAVENSANQTDSWLKVQNQLSAAWLMFGKWVSPALNAIGQGLSRAINWLGQITAKGTLLNDVFQITNVVLQNVGALFGQLAKVGAYAFNVMFGGFSKLYQLVRPILERLMLGVGGLATAIQGVFTFDMDTIKRGDKLFRAAFANNVSDVLDPKKNKVKVTKDTTKKTKTKTDETTTIDPYGLAGDINAFGPLGNGKGTTGGGNSSGGGSSSSAATGQNIVVNIAKLIGVETIHEYRGAMSNTQIADAIKNVVLSSLRDAQILAGD